MGDVAFRPESPIRYAVRLGERAAYLGVGSPTVVAAVLTTHQPRAPAGRAREHAERRGRAAPVADRAVAKRSVTDRAVHLPLLRHASPSLNVSPSLRVSISHVSISLECL